MADKANNHWDAIIIGSGMGGMTTAATLAKLGKKVLLLEQHHVLGGLTHSFARDDFHWDVGIHYLSSMAPDDAMRARLDHVCDTPMDFVSMGSTYDILHIGKEDPLPLSRPYEAQERDLKDRFPEHAQAIEAWTRALIEGREAMHKIFPTRAMPEILGDMLDWWNKEAIAKWCLRTTKEVIEELTDDRVLAAAMAAQWGDHGGRPSKASFAMHALIAAAFLESGAWYPVGGGSAYARHIIPTITKNGGDARAGVRVTGLLFEGKAVVGVKTQDGSELRADAVVSDAGARETIEKLLPADCGHEDWIAQIRALPSSIAHYTLFLGFEGDIEAAGATRANHWIYPEGEADALWTNAPDGTPPAMAISFGSLKNPEHDPGPRQRHMGQVLAWANWDAVAPWADTAIGARGEDYKEFKRRAEATLMAQFERYFPDLAKLVVYRELATPLSTVSYTGHSEGAFYGLDVTPERVVSDALRARTPIPGLFLTGQDVASPGIPGALMGGLLAAAAIDPKALSALKG